MRLSREDATRIFPSANLPPTDLSIEALMVDTDGQNSAERDSHAKQQETSWTDESYPTPRYSSQAEQHPRNENASIFPDLTTMDMRQTVGTSTAHLSDWINDNIIAVRYGAMATIGLLTAYGLSQTPLFFRYRSVTELPDWLFAKRRSITCRLMPQSHRQILHPNQPIRLYLRHLSPAERILLAISKSTYEKVLSWHPWNTLPLETLSVSSTDQSAPTARQLEALEVEIAGIQAAPEHLALREAPGEWLARLCRDRTTVSLQLIARRVMDQGDDTNEQRLGTASRIGMRKSKRDIPELDFSSSKTTQSQIAIGRLYYRPKLAQFQSSDVGLSLVRYGRATPVSDGLWKSLLDSHVVVESNKDESAQEAAKQSSRDATYASQLSQAEYEAAAGSYGMWTDAEIRKNRADIVDEAEFQTTAPVWKKAWRWIRRR